MLLKVVGVLACCVIIVIQKCVAGEWLVVVLWNKLLSTYLQTKNDKLF